MSGACCCGSSWVWRRRSLHEERRGVRVGNAVVGATIAAAIVCGIALFPRALDPGRAEENGVQLNLLVDYGDGTRSAEWYSSGGSTSRLTSDGILRLVANPASATQLLSRPLAVHRDRCYVVQAV